MLISGLKTYVRPEKVFLIFYRCERADLRPTIASGGMKRKRREIALCAVIGHQLLLTKHLGRNSNAKYSLKHRKS